MTGKTPITFSFWLLPGFSSLPLASAVEPLLACNRLEDEERYRIEYLSWDGGPVTSSNGMSCIVDKHLHDCLPGSNLVLCGGHPTDYNPESAWAAWLKAHSRQLFSIGGIASGGYLLAEAGLLSGKRASISWWDQQQLTGLFSGVRLSQDVFSVDSNRFTCKGGTAALDMMLMLIARQQGGGMGEALAQYFVRERVGGDDVSQRKRLSTQEMGEQPKLAEAIELMEANIEEPLSADDIAHHVAISRRQLERLFKRFLGSVPSRYYLQIRLDRGRRLLKSDTASVADIALRCGFSSGAHFSNAYRSLYGLTPSDERGQKAV